MIILYLFFLVGICTNYPNNQAFPAYLYYAKGKYISSYRDICPKRQCSDDTFYVSVCHEGKNMVGSAIRICKGQNIWDPSRGKCVDDPTCEQNELLFFYLNYFTCFYL